MRRYSKRKRKNSKRIVSIIPGYIYRPSLKFYPSILVAFVFNVVIKIPILLINNKNSYNSFNLEYTFKSFY